MPVFHLHTNIQKCKVPEDFNKEMTTLLSKIIGKPENAFLINVIPDQLLTCGGTSEPCGTVSLMSIGNLGPKENIVLCQAISEKIFEDLGIPDSRLVLTFKDVKDTEVGRFGTTIQDYLASQKE